MDCVFLLGQSEVETIGNHRFSRQNHEVFRFQISLKLLNQSMIPQNGDFNGED